MEISESELDYLRQTSPLTPPVIFFSSYDDFRTAIGQFSDMPVQARYVLEMDTGTFYVRQKELSDAAPGTVGKTPLNRLQNEDVSELEDLLDKAGLLNRGEFRALRNKGAQFREYVLDLFNNTSVRQKIEEILKPLLANNNFKKHLYASFITRALDVELSLIILRHITNIDPYDCLDPSDNLEIARDLFEFTETRVQPRSAILVEFILKNLLDHDDVAHWLLELGFHAAEIKTQELARDNIGSARFREANHLLGSVFKFSNINRMFGDSSPANDRIGKFYERGRRNELINMEPLFWLQYCIFQMHLGELPFAEEYIRTAYDRAMNRKGFQTYQIDTYALSLYMRLEEAAPQSSPVSRFGIIREKLEQVREMVNDGNHRNFALESLSKVESFILARINGLQKHEKVQMVYELNLIADRFEGLPLEVRIQFATDKVKDSVISAKNMLTA